MEKEYVQKTVRKAIKDREETKIDRVHGGKKPDRVRLHGIMITKKDIPIRENGKSISKKKVGKVHRDNFLGIDIIHA